MVQTLDGAGGGAGWDGRRRRARQCAEAGSDVGQRGGATERRLSREGTGSWSGWGMAIGVEGVGQPREKESFAGVTSVKGTIGVLELLRCADARWRQQPNSVYKKEYLGRSKREWRVSVDSEQQVQ